MNNIFYINMSNCVIVCLLAFSLVGMFVFKHINGYSTEKYIRFNNSLNRDQKIIYNEIKKERRNIFIISLFVSISLCILIISNLNRYNTKPKYLICFTLSLFIFILYMSYTLIPKSKYMLEYLTSQEQIRLWLDIYKSYRNANQYGLLFGILVFYIFYRFKNKRN
jgi:hypothetical protein